MVGVVGIEPTTSCSQSLPNIPNYSLVRQFIDYKKATKGLTLTGEYWLQNTLLPFIQWLDIPLSDVTTQHIAIFLGRYNNRPWRKHSFYRAFRTFWKWVSQTYDVPNPMLDRWGNLIIEPPKVPNKVLNTITPQDVKKLLEAASSMRDKAIISLLADSGARRNELVSIKVIDLDMDNNLIKVMGKGRKESYLIFGEATKKYLHSYINEANPNESLFELKSSGLVMMLKRLEAKTGIKCNAHCFRRGFA